MPVVQFLPNTVKSFDVDSHVFQSCFGFTAEDIETLLKDRPDKLELFPNISQWYNRFRIGSLQIFNPNSVILAYNQNWNLQCYATLTASIQELTESLLKHGLLPALNFQLLLVQGYLRKNVLRVLDFETIYESEPEFWSILHHAGVLTMAEPPPGKDEVEMYLSFPGRDMEQLINDTIVDRFIREGRILDHRKISEFVDTNNIAELKHWVTTYFLKAGGFLPKITGASTDFIQTANHLKLIMGTWTAMCNGSIVMEEGDDELQLTFHDGDNKPKVSYRISREKGFWNRTKKVMFSEEVIRLAEMTIRVGLHALKIFLNN